MNLKLAPAQSWKGQRDSLSLGSARPGLRKDPETSRIHRGHRGASPAGQAEQTDTQNSVLKTSRRGQAGDRLWRWQLSRFNRNSEPPVRTQSHSLSCVPKRMKVPAAVLLLLPLLLFGEPAKVHRSPLTQPGRGLAQIEEDEDEEEDIGVEGYDDEDYDDEEDNLIPGAGDRAYLQCYFCERLYDGQRCDKLQSCGPSQSFCKTVVSHSETASGFQTTLSTWCTDTCDPVTRTVEGTQLTVSCCKLTLCNVPPWQSSGVRDLPGSSAGGQPRTRAGGTAAGQPRTRGGGTAAGQPNSAAGGAKGSPSPMGTALLLTLLACLPAGGS